MDAKYDQVIDTRDYWLCFVKFWLISRISVVIYDAYVVALFQQFFLGDYRPLIQDTYGNVLDQVSSLPSLNFLINFFFYVLDLLIA